jgi:hypothetical protein
MYAYYFYRLLQRAKRVTLVFDSRTEALSRGEVCRYAKQLKYEHDLTLVEKQEFSILKPLKITDYC